MPRIITGLFKGKLLETPEGREVRPTSDRVRTSVFNILHSWLPGKKVLDLYSGCGAIGLECISRGAKSAIMVERAPEALRCLTANVKRLGANDKATVWRADVWDVLKNTTGYQMDLIYADPPYREVEMEKLLSAIDSSSFANDDTIVIIEHDETVKCAKDTEIATWRCYRSISYGKAQVSFFGRIGSFTSEEEE